LFQTGAAALARLKGETPFSFTVNYICGTIKWKKLLEGSGECGFWTFTQ